VTDRRSGTLSMVAYELLGCNLVASQLHGLDVVVRVRASLVKSLLNFFDEML